MCAHPTTVSTSSFTYDTRGDLASVRIVDGRPRTISFIDNSDGMVLQRQETDDSGANAPRELHYYFNDVPLGDISNNGTSDVDYAVSITEHTQLPAGMGAFQNGATSGTSYEDFDTSYDPINGLNYDSTASTYTVATGDTLESIAQQLWGDSSFWYMIADANGLSSDADLATGMDLIVPDKIHDIHNSDTTYQVYDPNEATGDTSPTVPHVQNHGGCGIIGEIVMAVVAVVVTYFTAGLGTEAVGGLISAMGGSVAAGTVGATVAAVGGAAIGAAVGSIASQGVGMAMGLQKGLNWNEVALAGISAGVGEGVGGITGLSDDAFTAGFERGVIGNVVTQGISLATGLQKKFDWAGVAAAGISAGVGGELGPGDSPLSNFGRGLVAGMAGDMVGAAVRTLSNGSDFGDNIIRSLPDAIGQGFDAALTMPTEAPALPMYHTYANLPPAPENTSSGDSNEQAYLTLPQDQLSPEVAKMLESLPVNPPDGPDPSQSGGEIVTVTGTRLPRDSVYILTDNPYSDGGIPLDLNIPLTDRQTTHAFNRINYQLRSSGNPISRFAATGGRDPQGLQSALFDSGKAVWNTGLDVAEFIPNLVGGATLPGLPDYNPYLSPYRAQYDTPLFGNIMELMFNLGGAKAVGDVAGLFEDKAAAPEAEGGPNPDEGPREFTSNDPLVGDAATKIEAAVPGSVRDVNVPIGNASLNSDADIQLSNGDVIEVTEGGGKGKIGQVANIVSIVGDTGEVMVYAPNMGTTAMRAIQSSGTAVFTNLDEMITYIKSKG